MFDEEGFELFAREIAAAAGLSVETGRHYAWRIGDTPELDENGEFTIVRDEQGQELARLIVPADE